MILQTQKTALCSLFMVMLCITYQAQAQKSYMLELSYKVGDKELMEISINQDITTNAGEMAMNITNNMNMWVSQECVEITPEGNFKLEQQISRVTLDMALMGQEMSVDTDEESTAADGPLHEVWKTLVALKGSKITVVLGKNGKTISTDYEEGFEEAAAKSGSSISSNLNNVVLPDAAIKVGDIWKQTVDNNVKGMTMEIATENKLMAVTKKVATIALKGVITPAESSELKINSGDLEGQIEFNTKAGRFNKTNLSFNFDMIGTQGGMEIPMTIEQNVVIVYSK